MSANAVEPFESYEYVSAEVPPEVARVRLEAVADGDANDYQQYGKGFVARVGRIVLAADTDKADGHLRLMAYHRPTKDRAVLRYDELIALYDIGGF